ncbi:hypothetical protein [Saccharothrix yanglingensis]|uniref:Uncharacterized protein n=1 Tax=Saccharothrix yanglingensis TaxID=659496 RepID=A0ABU0WRM7_9PSEU|nr:hypothetical protein [Saccharothrix yanglingensis]MDQ2582456.1 hypothetical protein [Saccharothrix yanglingensis]
MIRTADPVSSAPTRLRSAVGLGLAGSLLGAAAPLVGVVDAGAPPAFTAWPLLAVLAFAPTALAAVLLARGHQVSAAASLIAPAVLAVGRLLVDLQVLVDPLDTARPELFRPATLDAPTPAAGVWPLLAGHVLLVTAGALAATTLAEPDARAERARFVLPAVAGLLAGVGLFAAPFTSTDALVPARGPLDSPALPMLGGLLLVVAAPVLAVIAASATTPEARRGGLLGLAATLVTVALPPVATALATDRVGPAAGPFLVLAAAALLTWSQRDRAADRVTDRPAGRAEPGLPGLRRLHPVAGALGLVAAAAAVAGALTDQLVLPAGLPAPTDYAARLLWPAAVAVGVLGAALLARGAARPAFAVATATVPLAAAGALDAVFAATRVDAVQPGPGTWFTVVAALAALAAAVTAALAGAVERDEAGTASGEAPLPLIAGALIAALLAVGAFALPVIEARDYAPITAFGLRVGSWGLLVALVTVLGAAALALRARPGNGAALLLGAAAVTGTRALEYPLTAARAAGAEPGPGLWLALAATAALLVTAAVRTAR